MFREVTLNLMFAAELFEPRRFRITETEAPPNPGPGEIQAAVHLVGVCGSDLHYFSEGGIGESRCAYPMVLGHEPVGSVMRVGSGVSGWSRGDLAALEPAVYCYHCEFCMTGHHNVCAKIAFHGSSTLPGFFREVVNLPAANVLPLPKGMSDRAALLHEPLAVALHSLVVGKPVVGETALVFGGGPIGLLTVALLKLAGVHRLWVVEPVGHRRELARTVGADDAIDPAQADPVRETLRETCGRGVDVTFDCAAKGDTVNQSIHATRSAGRVVMTGIPSATKLAVDFHALRRREIALLSSHRSNGDGHAALRLLAEQPERFAPIVTHVRSLGAVQHAFELLERYEDGVGKLALAIAPA